MTVINKFNSTTENMQNIQRQKRDKGQNIRVPVMTVFMFSEETNFRENWRKCFTDKSLHPKAA